MNRTLSLLLLALVLGSCGIAVEKFPEGAAKSYCGQVYACCSATETSDAGVLGPDVAACNTRLTAQLDGKTGFIKAEEARGRLTYRPDVAQSCIDKLAALKCQELKVAATATPKECTTYLEPKVAVGAPCGLSESCVGGWCSGASLSQDGTCTTFVGEGQNCDAGQCTASTYCDGTRTCVKQKADGVSCGANFECGTGGCNGKDADGGVGTCGVRGGPGTTCFVTNGCSASGAGGLVLLALALLRGRRR